MALQRKEEYSGNISRAILAVAAVLGAEAAWGRHFDSLEDFLARASTFSRKVSSAIRRNRLLWTAGTELNRP